MRNAASTTLLACVTVAAAIAGTASAPDASSAALAEGVGRIRSDLHRVVPDNQLPGLTQRLDRAASAIESGRQYLALYEIEAAWTSVSAHRFAKSAGAAGNLQAFTALWKAEGEPPSRRRTGKQLPMIVEALASAAEARAPALYNASLPFARDASIDSGLYYLGESRAVVAFAAFARSVPWAPAGAPLKIPLLLPGLNAFEAQVTDAYARMAPAQHSAYVLTSAALKRARTLIGQGDHAGALLEYLNARYRFALLRITAAARVPDPSRLEEARSALTATEDHSIALLFIEMAQAALASPDEDARLGAEAVLEDVLPAYHAALGSGETSPTVTSAGSGVTITLVRWPFT